MVQKRYENFEPEFHTKFEFFAVCSVIKPVHFSNNFAIHLGRKKISILRKVIFFKHLKNEAFSRAKER